MRSIDPQDRSIFATALRGSLREGFDGPRIVRDLAAGAVVGVIAIPLSMALAIATGLPPQYGLYTAIFAGGLTALTGGSRTQVTGPTAAFIAVLVPIVHDYGLGGLMVASLLAGIILCGLGLARLGRLIEFVPFPVITGFTAGIAVVIAVLQVKDFLGLPIAEMPEHFIDKAWLILRSLRDTHAADAVTGGMTLALLIAAARFQRRIPAPLLVLPVVTVGVVLLQQAWPGFDPATINTRFATETASGIPLGLPGFVPPWAQPNAAGEAVGLSLDLLRALLPAAFAIAMLAAIESLLSAVIADGMTGKKHNPDGELIALGLGNIFGVFFGGFAATGAIARTAANVRYGGATPLAAFFHALVVLAAVLFFAPILGYLPISALAALLFVVAWNMADLRHLAYVLRIAPRGDVFVMFACLFLTVVFDMIVAVTAGMLLAAILFIRRMAEVSSVRLIGPEHEDARGELPEGVLIYEIAGPLFFGAGQKAMASIDVIGLHVHTVIFDLREVPVIDVTGLINFESAIRRLQGRGVRILLAGVDRQPREALAKANFTERHGKLPVFDDLDKALAALPLR